MKFVIRYETRGGAKIHFYQKEMSIRQANLLHYYLCTLPGVKVVRIYERTTGAAVVCEGSCGEILEGIQGFSYGNGQIREPVPRNSGRVLDRRYKERLVQKVMTRAFTRSFLLPPVPTIYAAVRSIQYLSKGIRYSFRGKLEVKALDTTTIAVSVLRRDFDTVGSAIFLPRIGELLEEWTHKRSVSNLARSMSLDIFRVWQKVNGTEVLVPASKTREGNLATVRMENAVPLDGVVASRDAMMDQAPMTGELASVRKGEGSHVYVGTTVEEGEIAFRARGAAGDTRFERTVTMTEESEQFKFVMGDGAATLADASVPWGLGDTVLTWSLVHDVTKTLSILIVDFSRALKLTMPLPVLSAMREAGNYHTMVKDGKHTEAMTAAHTIIFDKTGTLTKVRPQVTNVVAFNGMKRDELLRIVARLEERFPHSMANAAVHEAVKRGLVHREMHSRVGYIVIHDMATYVDHERVVIGGYHFVFEDEGCRTPEDKKEVFDRLPVEYSHLYLTIGGSLAAAIYIRDPLRDETDGVVTVLHRQGITKIVMTMGDSERTTAVIVGHIGVDEYYSEVLPEGKARFANEEKRKGRRVIMIGDRTSDSPASSAADVGIAISGGTETAREIAGITVSKDNLSQLVTLRAINRGLMDRIDRSYRPVIGFSLGLILLGVGGAITPATSAMLHNTLALAISLKSTTSLLD